MLPNFLDWIECERSHGFDLPNYKYIEIIINRIQEKFLMNISIPRMLIITMPPRSYKTTLAFNLLPHWILETFPYRTLGFYSHDESFVNNKRKELPKTFYYKINNMNSGVRPLIDTFIVNGCCKNNEEAFDIKKQMDIYSNFEQIVLHKLLTNAFILVIGSRWAKNDFIGIIFDHIKKGVFPFLIDYINIPAISNQFDFIRRDLSESYCPERCPLNSLLEIQKTVGAKQFEALYQGMPTE